MEYLKEYAQNIVIISVIATVFEMMMPEGKNKKYIAVVVGLLVMLVIMQPIEKITNIRKNFSFVPEFEFEMPREFSKETLVADRFERELAATIKGKTKADLNIDIECNVRVKRTSDGIIEEIEKVEISKGSAEIMQYIEKEFGIERAKINGRQND